MDILKNVKNFGLTRKFWVATVGGFVSAVLLYYGENVPEWVNTLVFVATALGVYRVPNTSK